MGGGGPAKVIKSVAKVAEGVAGVVGLGPQKIKFPKTDVPKAKPPKGPTPDLTLQQLRSKQQGMGQGAPPVFLGISPQMTPLQQRTKIATMATQGQGAFTDPTAAQYYRQLALSNLINQPYESVLPVEQQYVQQVLGEQIRQPTTGSFLSAIERAVS